MKLNKEIKLFYLHCSCKILLSTQVRRIKIKHTLPDKLRNSWKIIFNSSKALQQLYPQLPRICWGHSTSCFIYNFVIQVISEKKLCSEGFTSNLRDIVLHENNCDYHSYRFSYKFSFILFLFCYKPNIWIRFSASCWSGTKKYFCFLFIVSCALLQSHAEFYGVT